MMLTLVLAAVGATTPTAIDAERAFSRDAQRMGQWTASRVYADPDAVMFTPQAVWAREFLKGRKDPTAATRWSPNASYVSCDGRLAVNTGPWQSPNGGKTAFSRPSGNRKRGSGAGFLTADTPLKSRLLRARLRSCAKRHVEAAHRVLLLAAPSTKTGPGGVAPDDFGRGYSNDRTLGWDWRVGPRGVRQFRTFLWTGRRYTLALDQTIGGK
jgi:hypothetical protein